MIEIDLLPAELKKKPQGATFSFTPTLEQYLPAVIGVIGLLMAVHLILAVTVMRKQAMLRRLTKQSQAVDPARKALAVLKADNIALSTQLEEAKRFITDRKVWAEKLNTISLNLPYGIWLTEFIIQKDTFTLQGSVVSLQEDAMTLINKFIDSLKGAPAFSGSLASLELNSLKSRTVGTLKIVDFVLYGSLQQ